MPRSPLSLRLAEALDARLRASAPPAVHRAAYRVGYALLRPWWRIVRPHTRGVKVVLCHGDRMLLVRHSYARRHQWDLPGGFVGGDEDPVAAVVRELREELGVVVSGVPLALGTSPSRAEGKREVLHLYRVEVTDERVRPDPAEISDVRWVPRDALPPGTNRYARRAVARAGWELWDAPVP